MAEHNITWPTLKNLQKPVRIRDAMVLPVTGRFPRLEIASYPTLTTVSPLGFSPGVGMFGAGGTADPEAMVQHFFAGSWKTRE